METTRCSFRTFANKVGSRHSCPRVRFTMTDSKVGRPTVASGLATVELVGVKVLPRVTQSNVHQMFPSVVPADVTGLSR